MPRFDDYAVSKALPGSEEGAQEAKRERWPVRWPRLPGSLFFIAPGTLISADESDAYDLLHAHFPMRRANHQVEYRADDATANNPAKAYFSRFRRMEIGQTHPFGTRYLANCAKEAAYREDIRRLSNRESFRDILRPCARTHTIARGAATGRATSASKSA